MGRINGTIYAYVVNGLLATSMSALAEIPGNALGSGLPAVIATIKAPILRFATTDCKLALLLVLHAS